MIDINLFRDKQGADRIRESEKKRFKDPQRVNRVIELDEAWRDAKKVVDDLRKERNTLSKQIGQLKKEKNDSEAQIVQEKVRTLNVELKQKEEEGNRFLKERDDLRYTIGNVIHESVPIAKEETGNEHIRSWGTPVKATYHKGHADLVELLDVAELAKAAEKAVDAWLNYLQSKL